MCRIYRLLFFFLDNDKGIELIIFFLMISFKFEVCKLFL